MKITEEARSPEEMDEFDVYCNEPPSRFFGWDRFLGLGLCIFWVGFGALLVTGLLAYEVVAAMVAWPFRRRRA